MIHMAIKKPGQCIRIDRDRMVVVVGTSCNGAQLAIVSNDEGEQLAKEISSPCRYEVNNEN